MYFLFVYKKFYEKTAKTGMMNDDFFSFTELSNVEISTCGYTFDKIYLRDGLTLQDLPEDVYVTLITHVRNIKDIIS